MKNFFRFIIINFRVWRHAVTATLFNDRQSKNFLTKTFLESEYGASRIPPFSIPRSRINGKVVISHEDFSLNFQDRESLCTLGERVALAYFFQKFKNGNFLEIGVFKGVTTELFFTNCPEGTYFGLDQHDQRKFHSDIKTVFFGNSNEFDFSHFPVKFDLIFIDGGHDYETVKKDTENSLLVLEEGGVILWDDYKPSTPGVFNYLNQVQVELQLRHIEGTSIVVYEHKRG